MTELNKERRQFLKRSLIGTAGASTLAYSQLGLMNSALAQSSGISGDYKALVCVYLFGGNDSYNMLVPIRGRARTDYASARKNLTVEDPLELSLGADAVDGGLGLPPQMEKLKGIFDKGKLAIQANVGVLGRPAFGGQPAIIPDNLFAHNEQTHTWLRGAELHQGTRGSGWAGRMMDLLASDDRAKNHYLENISLTGKNLWSTGFTTSPLTIKDSTVPKMKQFRYNTGAVRRSTILEDYYRTVAQGDHIMVREYANTFLESEAKTKLLQSELDSLSDINTEFPDTGLARQLKRVAELIQLSKDHNLSRQIFFVGIGGFDTHSNQRDAHLSLLQRVSDSMAAFYDATVELGIENQVTTFTASEFGRTMSPNGGAGTDHGWGGHQFIMGGEVNGKIYGDLQRHALGNPQDVGAGRMTPTTSNDQMTAALAHWFGLSQSEIRDILPNYHAFDPISYFS